MSQENVESCGKRSRRSTGQHEPGLDASPESNGSPLTPARFRGVYRGREAEVARGGTEVFEEARPRDRANHAPNDDAVLNELSKSGAKG